MLRELADALEAVTAEQALVVALEDLHWSDRASVDLLSFLARRRLAARLFVIGTYRPADVVAREHPVASVKDDLASHGLCRELALERLTEVGVRRYVAAFGAHAEDISAELAAHFERGRESGRAVPYLELAARKVLRRNAPRQAVRHLERALGILAALPDTAERARQALSVRTALGQALTAIHGYMARDVEHAYRRARELSQGMGPSPALGPVLFGFWAFHLVRAEHETAKEVGLQLRQLAAAAHGDGGLRVVAHCAVGISSLCTGKLAEGHAELEQAASLYDPRQHRSLAVSYGVDPWVASRAYMGLALWLLGFTDQAARASEDATAYARELGHLLSVAFSLNLAALLFIARREPPLAEQRVDALIALSSELSLPYWTAQSAVQQGWALIQRGRREEGTAQMRVVLDAWRSEGRALLGPSYQAAMAEAYGAMGQVEHGLDVLDEALAELERSGERWWESELRRLRGELVLRLPSSTAAVRRQRSAEAEDWFQQALAVARGQGARSLELRAAASLARLWQGRASEATGAPLLKEIYGWFTEGLDTADALEARGPPRPGVIRLAAPYFSQIAA